MCRRSSRMPALRTSAVVLAAAIGAWASVAHGQAADDVKIARPTVDKAAGRVTLPGAFWNAQVAEWVEVAVSGRPSDFLHETVLCITTTRTLMEDAFREAGFRDGDVWANSLRDFNRVRGD